MTIQLSEIKKLRELTGVGMTDAKKALETSGGDFDQALQEMRRKGLTKAEKRAQREALSGIVSTYNHDNRIGVVVEVNCETDFVARNEIFTNLVKDITLQVAATNPEFLSINDVTAEEQNRVRLELTQKATANSKSAEIVSKIVDGQVKKYFAEKCLVDQPFIKNPDQTIGQYVTEHNARLGENIVIRRFSRFELGQSF